MRIMKVQICSDVVCPWCYLGVTRFERAAAAYSIVTGDPVEISLRAYQLDPDASSVGAPLMDAMAAKFGGEANARAMLGQVEAAGKITGIDFNFDEAVRGNTFDAHRLLTWAETTGSAVAQRDFAQELWRGYFLEGADIADHDTLAARAGVAGLDPVAADAILGSEAYAEDVRLQIETARDMGITAVPTILIERRYVIRGAQSQDAYVQALNQIGTELRSAENA